jgi:excisionase family DNA binding protein
VTPAQLDAALTRRPEAKFTSVARASTVLGVSQMTVRRLIERGDLLAYRFGRAIRIRLDDLADYMTRAELGAEWKA